MRSRRREDQPV